MNILTRADVDGRSYYHVKGMLVFFVIVLCMTNTIVSIARFHLEVAKADRELMDMQLRVIEALQKHPQLPDFRHL